MRAELPKTTLIAQVLTLMPLITYERMTRKNTSAKKSLKPMNQPSLEQLLKQYLARLDVRVAGEVELYQNQLANTVWLEPIHHWPAATLIQQDFGLSDSHWSFTTVQQQAWQRCLREMASQPIVWYAFGHVPAMLREWQPLYALEEAALAPWQITHGLNVTLHEDASTNAEGKLLQAVLHRCQGDWSKARQLLHEVKALTKPAWHPWVDHELAVVDAMSGQVMAAQQHWQNASVPTFATQFNLGLIALISRSESLARKLFDEACHYHPAESPWHHLSQLYAACCAVNQSS